MIGQLVTPQKTAAIPQAAQIDGEIPIRLPITQPKVAPMQKEGTISPPRNPARIVSAVSTIFQKKAKRIRLSVFHRFFNKLRTSAHIFICSQNKGDNNDQAGAHCNPDDIYS